MSTINYAVEIITSTTTTNATWGLQSGVFRFITGRPGYAGSAPYPTWENTTNNTNIWYEGWLLQDAMTSASRQVDITQSGDYGSLSGFNFKIRNDSKFWDYLQVTSIWLCNRQVKLYVVIDGRFYQIWDGVISNEPYSETDYEFICVDSFKKIHKEMPPYDVNATTDPDAGDDSLGDPVPIVMGDAAYVKLIKTDNLKKEYTLLVTFGKEYKVCNVVNYYTILNSYASIDLITNGVTFATDALLGKYLVVVKGDQADSGKLIRIRSNVATTFNATFTALGDPTNETLKNVHVTHLFLDDVPTSMTGYDTVNKGFFNLNSNNFKYSQITAPGNDRWWVKVIDFSVALVPSQRVVTYQKDDSGNILLYVYDKDTNSFIRANDKIQITTTGIQTVLTLRATSINEDGQIDVVSPVPITAEYPELFDLNWAVTDPALTVAMSIGNNHFTYGRQWILYPQKDYDYTKISNAYMAMTGYFGTTTVPAIDICFKFEAFDAYGRYITDSSILINTSAIYTALDVSSAPTTFEMIPYDYYNNEGSRGTNYIGGQVAKVSNGIDTRISYCEIPALIEMLKIGGISKIFISMGLRNNALTVAGTTTFTIREIGIWATKTISSLEGDIYASVKGETVGNDGTIETNNVYGAFRHILEDYDAIPAASLDYSNLSTTRYDWPVSRQLTEKKNSFDYLKELAEHSFVAIAPTRLGKRKLKAWREDATVVATFTQANILRDSITAWTKTELLNMFNKFSLKYQYNVASKKFERSLSITNVSAAAFPLSTDVTWKTYVSGLNENSYQEASSKWTICHDAYLKSLQEAKAPDNLSSLYWYSSDNSYASVDDSAYKFLTNLTEWSTRQKETVIFKVPLTSTTLTYELLDYINFSDDIFTNSVVRPGWITSISVDSKEGTITLGCTLEPIELYEDTVIIERGKLLNVDWIAESINQTDTVAEPV